MVLGFNQLLGQNLKKVAHFVKRHEKSSIWPKLATFGTNYHGFGFSATFLAKVEKSGSFREKARKIMDLAKTINFWHKLSWPWVLRNFRPKVAKSGSFRDKA